jgi:hypothetical protein
MGFTKCGDPKKLAKTAAHKSLKPEAELDQLEIKFIMVLSR